MNIDQTGVVLVPENKDRTYELQGSKKVSVHGKEEKQAFIAVLAVAATREVLPTQSVWKGATNKSLPTRDAFKIAIASGHQFAFNKSTHWSSFSTSKAWIEEILMVYRDCMIRKHGLDVNSKIIFYLDCWTVN